MKKKGLKYSLVLIVLILAAYNSVYFKKLDEVKASAAPEFDAAAYARTYFDKKLAAVLDKATEINKLVALLKTDPEKAFSTWSHALGIGNIRYFLVSGEGEITGIDENDVSVLAKAGTSEKTVKIATEYVFGNAVRDASGLVNINEFNNTMDFNNVSAEINKIIRKEVVPPFKAKVKKGELVQFTGALELNREHLNTDSLEIIPVRLKIISKR